MNKIEVKVLNPSAIIEAEDMMVTAARLTQRGEKIKNMTDFMKLRESTYKPETVKTMAELPHPTIQKFSVINIAVVGASRRFLAQVTRHQNEVKFMSASLAYSDYSDSVGPNDFVIPYEVMTRPIIQLPLFLATCQASMDAYEKAISLGLDHDSAGYMAPQSLRNVLIISATPYQFKHMISQRTCRRNTDEMRYVMLRIWEELFKLSPEMFSPKTTGPFCVKHHCEEGKMSCGKPFSADVTPTEMIAESFPLLMDSHACEAINCGVKRFEKAVKTQKDEEKTKKNSFTKALKNMLSKGKKEENNEDKAN